MVLNLNSFKYSLYCLLEKGNKMYVLVEFEQWHAPAAGGPSGDQNAGVDLFSKSPGAQNTPPCAHTYTHKEAAEPLSRRKKLNEPSWVHIWSKWVCVLCFAFVYVCIVKCDK